MFYEIFTTLCESHGIKPTATLKKLNVSTSKLTAWKNGSLPSATVLLLLSEFFSVSIDYLLKGSEAGENLSEEESELIINYRTLSNQGQEYIQQQMFMAKEVYKKANISDQGIKAV